MPKYCRARHISKQQHHVHLSQVRAFHYYMPISFNTVSLNAISPKPFYRTLPSWAVGILNLGNSCNTEGHTSVIIVIMIYELYSVWCGARSKKLFSLFYFVSWAPKACAVNVASIKEEHRRHFCKPVIIECRDKVSSLQLQECNLVIEALCLMK